MNNLLKNFNETIEIISKKIDDFQIEAKELLVKRRDIIDVFKTFEESVDLEQMKKEVLESKDSSEIFLMNSYIKQYYDLKSTIHAIKVINSPITHEGKSRSVGHTNFKKPTHVAKPFNKFNSNKPYNKFNNSYNKFNK